MKIKIIEPVIETENTRETEFDHEYIQRCLGEGVEYDIEFIAQGLESLESLTEQAVNIPEVLKIVNKVDDEEFDGIFVNCFDDPGVAAAHEITKLPIFGGFLPAITIASRTGLRIAIVTTSHKGDASLEHLFKVYGVSKYIQDVRYLDEAVLDLNQKEKTLQNLLQQCKIMHQQKTIDTVIIGCTAMSYLVHDLKVILRENDLPLQIIEPKMAGLKMVKMVAEMGLSNSFLSASKTSDYFFDKTILKN
jgi:allantoin racemase